MNISNQILSDVTVFTKYARWIPQLKRRESWEEIVTRNKNMHLEKFPQVAEKIEHAYKFVYDKKVLPSMRSLQFGGKPINISPNRIYNCGYLPVDSIDSFSEIMFLLLGGTGIGYSVQNHHVENLPIINKPKGNNRRYLIADSIEGWADAVKYLLKSYYGLLTSKPIFDYSDIRRKGAMLVTSGGKAPGPEPLRICLTKLEGMLSEKEDGSKLTSLEVHDMVCHIADAVLAGGIRRAALISLFSFDDESMLSCKTGKWWELHGQRARANNSAVALRHKITENDFYQFWEKVKYSNSGEPGIYFTNNSEWGCNPCCEIGLRPFQFCNLTEINASNVESQEDLNERAAAASFIGTLQAGYTDFHYLRDIWKKTTQKDSLIGVSMTGIASGKVLKLDLKQAAHIVIQTNHQAAEEIGINKAARTTCIKPSGTTSLVLGCSSGIHGWHAPYYIRRMRVGKNESIYNYLVQSNPELVKDEYFRPNEQAVLEFPQKAPTEAIYRTETSLQTLKRIKLFHDRWIKPGHIDGQNTHNVSATISLKDNEWEKVGIWMWENRNCYNGLAVLPFDGGIYKQAPFESIDEETYNEMEHGLKNIDLTQVVEVEDKTELTGELACAGGACEIM